MTTTRDVLHVPVRDIMRHGVVSVPGAQAHQAIAEPVVAIAPGAPVRDAIDALSPSGTSRLLVCEDGTVAAGGVVTPLDIVAATRR